MDVFVHWQERPVRLKLDLTPINAAHKKRSLGRLARRQDGAQRLSCTWCPAPYLRETNAPLGHLPVGETPMAPLLLYRGLVEESDQTLPDVFANGRRRPWLWPTLTGSR